MITWLLTECFTGKLGGAGGVGGTGGFTGAGGGGGGGGGGSGATMASITGGGGGVILLFCASAYITDIVTHTAQSMSFFFINIILE